MLTFNAVLCFQLAGIKLFKQISIQITLMIIRQQIKDIGWKQ